MIRPYLALWFFVNELIWGAVQSSFIIQQIFIVGPTGDRVDWTWCWQYGAYGPESCEWGSEDRRGLQPWCCHFVTAQPGTYSFSESQFPLS